METAPVTAPVTQTPEQTGVAAQPAQQQSTPAQEVAAVNPLAIFAGKSKTAREEIAKAQKPSAQPQNAPPANVTSAQQQNAPAPAASVEQTAAPENTGEVVIPGLGKVTLTPPAPAKPAAPAVTIDSPDAALKALSAKFGITGATPAEIYAGAEKAWTAHREQAQEAGVVKSKLKDIESDFAAMPEEIVESIKAWGEGRDYKEPFTKQSGLDLKKAVDQQDPAALVKHYYPDKFTEEELKDIDNPTSRDLQIAVEASKDKFATAKKAYDMAAVKAVNDSKEYKRIFSESVQSTLSRVTEDLPFFTDESAKEALRAELGALHQLRGTALAKEFLDDKGALLPDAAAKLTMLKYGKPLMDVYAKKEAALAASSAREEVVARGAKAPTQNGGHTGLNVNEVPEEVKTLQSMLPKKESIFSRKNTRTTP